MQIKNIKLQDNVSRLWNSLDNSIQINKRGLNGKQRILSIITNNFNYREIYDNLQVFKNNFHHYYNI